MHTGHATGSIPEWNFLCPTESCSGPERVFIYGCKLTKLSPVLRASFCFE